MANFWLPALNFQQLRQVLTGGKASAAPVAAWWSLYVIGGLGSYVGRMFRSDQPKLGHLLILGLSHDLLIGLAGALLLALILETEGLLRRRALETQSNSTGQAEIQHPVGAP